MAKHKKTAQKPQNSLDTVSRNKRGRGRPGVNKTEIAGRGYRYRLLFENIWNWAGERMIQARNGEEVLAALDQNEYHKRELECVASLIPRVTTDPRFPRSRQARINFLADSLAALGAVSPRRSRDICEEMRAIHRRKTRYKILRREYYIECSCGYKGPARNDACPKCGAEISASFGFIYSFGFR